MPLYNCSSTAAALGVSAKWLDNILSHNDIDGVSRARQGVPRRLSSEAIMTIAIANELNSTAAVPIATALPLAARLLSNTDHTVQIGAGLTLTLDAMAVRTAMMHRLAHAVEVTPTPPRGRPKR
jgi:hypothetical protein